jgi:hypothetical protein
MVHEMTLHVLHLIASKLLNRGEQNYRLSHPGDHKSDGVACQGLFASIFLKLRIFKPPK